MGGGGGGRGEEEADAELGKEVMLAVFKAKSIPTFAE